MLLYFISAPNDTRIVAGNRSFQGNLQVKGQQEEAQSYPDLLAFCRDAGLGWVLPDPQWAVFQGRDPPVCCSPSKGMSMRMTLQWETCCSMSSPGVVCNYNVKTAQIPAVQENDGKCHLLCTWGPESTCRKMQPLLEQGQCFWFHLTNFWAIQRRFPMYLADKLHSISQDFCER